MTATGLLLLLPWIQEAPRSMVLPLCSCTECMRPPVTDDTAVGGFLSQLRVACCGLYVQWPASVTVSCCALSADVLAWLIASI